MKIKTFILTGLMATSSLSWADLTGGGYVDNAAIRQTDQSTKKTAEYLFNLGQYIGGKKWNLSDTITYKPFINKGTIASNSVLRMIANLTLPSSSKVPLTLFNQGSSFSNQFDSLLNSIYPNFNQAAKNLGSNAYPGLDTPSYMDTPTSQIIQNILSRDNNIKIGSLCDKNQELCSVFASLLTVGGISVPTNTTTNLQGGVQDLPSLTSLTDGTKNKYIVPSLDANSLINPLSYNDKTIGAFKSDNQKNIPQGLLGKSQREQADSFIRYATGQVLPFQLADATEYANMVNAFSKKANQVTKDKLQAAAVLNAYSAMVRSYAAQASVSVSNLYHIFGKRVANANNNYHSQAADEFNLATYRLRKKPNAKPNAQSAWVRKLNQASPIEVQRQIALLLAEMNYQLYLSRQDQERMLLSLSVMQGEFLATLKPTLSFTSAKSIATGGASGASQIQDGISGNSSSGN